MPASKGFFITKRILVTASGIDEREINRDVQRGMIEFKNGFIWYKTALDYVWKKWNDGNVKMYPQKLELADHLFSAQVLSCLDDEVAAGNVKMEWKKS